MGRLGTRRVRRWQANGRHKGGHYQIVGKEYPGGPYPSSARFQFAMFQYGEAYPLSLPMFSTRIRFETAL